MTTANWRSALVEGAHTLGLSLPTEAVDALLAYLGLLQKWNQVYNLTAVREPADMLTHHLLDSLAVIQPLRRHLDKTLPTEPAGSAARNQLTRADNLRHSEVSPLQTGKTRLLDVGSGAGLPGVVIAICCPDIIVDCVDTVAKKTAFINQVAVSLKLKNLRGLHARVEKLAELPYDVISSRAFASLQDFVTGSGNSLAERGVWIAMKGKHPAEELAQLPPSLYVFHVEQLMVPGLHAERCLIWMKPKLAE